MEKQELEKEYKYLDFTLEEIDKQINELSEGLHIEEENLNEFNHYIFKEKGSMDDAELKSNLMQSSLEENTYQRKYNYCRKLNRIKTNPYFARIDIKLDDKPMICYIGITYLVKDDYHMIYDWRAPVSSLFYDSEMGNTEYRVDDEIIKCKLTRKRQYKIEDCKLINVFDNELNVNDQVLQEVLSKDSSDKMKNIVNTIQKEQNSIIRNTSNKHLIVQGIAGSGKTSVALHRIAFLLYKLPNLKSRNILIFSPNHIFSDYISNVLPELGENNTGETTFSDFASFYIKEYKSVESFSEFISRYYKNEEKNKDLVKYKQSNEIIKVLENYVFNLIKNVMFIDDLDYNDLIIHKEELNYYLRDRYSKLDIFDRIEHISEHLCNQYRLKGNKKASIQSKLFKLLNFDKDYKKIYFNFYKSEEFVKSYKYLDDFTIDSFVNKKEINYEDSLLFIYMKGLIQGFPYSSDIKEIVIDEAQDYSVLQYIILKNIFKKASFTILGDINQTINPYYQYLSLEEIEDILKEDTLFLTLNKTYRSSKEIIDYSNRVLNLKLAVAIRKSTSIPVLERISEDITSLKNDIRYLQSKYKKVCVLVKDNNECNNIYDKLKDEFNISNMLEYNNVVNVEEFNHNLIIIPTYLAKGLEFDSVIIYNSINNAYKKEEKYLFYVAITRCMHELIVYNN